MYFNVNKEYVVVDVIPSQLENMTFNIYVFLINIFSNLYIYDLVLNKAFSQI